MSALIRARSTALPSCLQRGVPFSETEAAGGTSAAAAGTSPAAAGGTFPAVGAAVNTKLVPRSVVDDLMNPLANLDRSVSDYLREG